MGLFWKGIPENFLPAIRELLGNEAIAIETGTYLGSTSKILGQCFLSCYSIERDPSLAKYAKKRLAKFTNIKVLQGSSRELLADIIPANEIPLVFWLDAHFSAGITSGSDDPCPLISELETILNKRQPNNTIVLIDDARGLTGSNGWPSLGQVCQHFTNEQWAVVALDDVIIASSNQNTEKVLFDCWPTSKTRGRERLNKYTQFLDFPKILNLISFRLKK